MSSSTPSTSPFDDAGAGLTDPGAPRLSVLLPTWNAAATVEQALASILDEVDVRLECLVIDDASTDGTADVAQAVADRDPRVVVVRLPANVGVSNARNRGLELARGQWLAFLDADDVILPGGLAALMGPTADASIKAVIGQRIWFDGERRWISGRYDQPDIRQPGRKSIATHPGLMTYAAIHGKTFHRSLARDLRFEGRVLGDQAWTISALLRAGDHIEVIGDDVYEWFRPPLDSGVGGITAATRNSTASAADMVLRAPIVYGAVSDEVDRRIDDEATRQRLKRAYFERLVLSDLAIAIDAALKRHDPATDRLLVGIAAFLEVVPVPVRSGSGPAIERLLWPPAARWRSLVPSARASYWRMARDILRADPRPTRQITPRGAAIPAFTIARRFDGRPADALASTAMSIVAVAHGVARRVSQGVR